MQRAGTNNRELARALVGRPRPADKHARALWEKEVHNQRSWLIRRRNDQNPDGGMTERKARRVAGLLGHGSEWTDFAAPRFTPQGKKDALLARLQAEVRALKASPAPPAAEAPMPAEGGRPPTPRRR